MRYSMSLFVFVSEIEKGLGCIFLGGKKDQKSHFSLTHATPLLPAPTLSEGECRVSAG